MVIAGKIGFIIGLIITVVCLIVGFTVMFMHYDNLAQVMFMTIPIGFMLMFFGLSTVVLFGPREE